MLFLSSAWLSLTREPGYFVVEFSMGVYTFYLSDKGFRIEALRSLTS